MQVAAFIEKRRPSPDISAELDLAFRIRGPSIEIFTIRPHWTDPGKINESPVAKTTYIKSKLHWKIFWMRADQK